MNAVRLLQVFKVFKQCWYFKSTNQLRQSIASKDATKSSEDYQDANTDLQNAYNRAVSDAEGIISATNNPEMNPDTINQKR